TERCEVRRLDRRVGDQEVVEALRAQEKGLLGRVAHQPLKWGAPREHPADQLRHANGFRRDPDGLPASLGQLGQLRDIAIECVQVDDRDGKALLLEKLLPGGVVELAHSLSLSSDSSNEQTYWTFSARIARWNSSSGLASIASL